MLKVKMEWPMFMGLLLGSMVAGIGFSLLITTIAILILGHWSWDVALGAFAGAFIYNLLSGVYMTEKYGFKKLIDKKVKK